ncbi:hypothetical protein HanRHA438_Chr10g0431751 [Helianthus annuus]|nr:hypothetical protein HanRHA438_Chr10g0431751 [Helianthus annuus]
MGCLMWFVPVACGGSDRRLAIEDSRRSVLKIILKILIWPFKSPNRNPILYKLDLKERDL